jgi:hypothetical protein
MSTKYMHECSEQLQRKDGRGGGTHTQKENTTGKKTNTKEFAKEDLKLVNFSNMVVEG